MVSPPGVVSSPDGADVTVPLSTGEWLLSFWPAHLAARKHADPKRRPFEAIVEEGEVIFVPHGYWHMVVNLDDCIAVTHNYVSSSNLSDVLRFLREKPDQISGVRDRIDHGAVQPEALYDQFLARLTSVLSAEAVARAESESRLNRSCLMPKRPAAHPYVCVGAKRVKTLGEGGGESGWEGWREDGGGVGTSDGGQGDATSAASRHPTSSVPDTFSFSFF